MKISELRTIIRARGTIYVPVLLPGDVLHVQAVKSDLLYLLRDWPDGDVSPWEVTIRDEGLFLDLNHG